MRYYLIFLILLLSLPAQAARYALVIGNANYPAYEQRINHATPLPNAIHDAQDIADFLSQELPEAHRFQVTLIKNANRQQMDTAIKRFEGKLQAGDVALFYFSGHGVRLFDIDQKENVNYLLPVAHNFANGTDVKFNAINAKAILDRMNGYDPNRPNAARKKLTSIMILDACQEKIIYDGSKSAAPPAGFSAMGAEGVLVAYAAAQDQLAYTDAAMRNSLFTGQLLTQMRNGKHESFETVINRTADQVMSQTEGTDKYQSPWKEGIMRGMFCLGGCMRLPIESDSIQATPALTEELDTTPPALDSLPLFAVGAGVLLVLILLFMFRRRSATATPLSTERETRAQQAREAARQQQRLDAQLAEKKAAAEKHMREELARQQAEHDRRLRAEKAAAAQKLRDETQRQKAELQAKLQAEQAAAEQKLRETLEQQKAAHAAQIKAEQAAKTNHKEKQEPKAQTQATLIDERYLAHNDGTVLDKHTGLMWMRCALGQQWNPKTQRCEGKAAKMDWNTACQQKGDDFAGYQDWRIPTIDELKTLVDKSQKGATIHPQAFPDCPAWLFWSGSPVSSDASYAWVVIFNYGYGSYGNRYYNAHVRLVRERQ